MIHYKRGGRWHLINILKMRGSLFPASFFVAAPCALICFFLKQFELVQPNSVLLNSTAWSGFSALVGFLVVFRTSEAYSRFWDGCTATHQMRAEWIDAASAIMSFCKHSSAPEEQIVSFKHLAVRLFSLLHAMALGEIEECEDLEQVMAFNLELIDPCGLDKESWRTLLHCHNKVTLVFTWLQTTIVENIKTGVLSIPPPILSRVFQELANGMVCLHEAQKISNIPFPFPYAQTCDALLFMHWMITPAVTAQWSADSMWATVFSFIQVFILWSLNNIAVEIEHPFGNDANDLDASQMQLDMNMSLLLVLHPAATRSPMLSPQAQIHNLVTMGRGASQAISSIQSYNDVITGGHAESEDQRNSFWLRASHTEGNGQSSNGHVEGHVTPLSTDFTKEPEVSPPTNDRLRIHMEPVCSSPVCQHQVGDTGPLPVMPSPRVPGPGAPAAAGGGEAAAGAGSTGGTEEAPGQSPAAIAAAQSAAAAAAAREVRNNGQNGQTGQNGQDGGIWEDGSQTSHMSRV